MLARPAEEKFNLPGSARASAIEFGEILGRQVRRHDQRLRHARDRRDAGEIVRRIERQIGIYHRADGMAVRGEHQRVAVGSGFRHAVGAGDAGAVLDHHGLLPEPGQFVGKHARKTVCAAAGRERHHDAHGLVGIVALPEREPGSGNPDRRGKTSNAVRVHAVLPCIGLGSECRAEWAAFLEGRKQKRPAARGCRPFNCAVDAPIGCRCPPP